MNKRLKAWEPSNATGGAARYGVASDGVDSDDRSPSMLVYKTDKDWYWAADLCGGGETFTGHESSKEAAIAAAEASPHGFDLTTASKGGGLMLRRWQRIVLFGVLGGLVVVVLAAISHLSPRWLFLAFILGDLKGTLRETVKVRD